ncbi:MAG: hypothetical protein JSS53_02650, partial [Proteobacteria bacterium]|nr:hypothetical protein [Pseudomonadota bacterium]
INLILDNDGNTALLLALKQGSYELVKEILLLNPNLFSEDRFGQTVFDICTVDLVTSLFSNRESRKETLSELKNSNNSPSSLWDKNGDLKGIEQIKKALHRNCDLEKKSSRGITPLITATRKKNTFESLLVLIKAGCDINARDLSDKNLSQILDSRDCVFSVEEKKQIRKTMQSVMKSKSQAETLVSAVNAGYYNVVLSAINNGEDVNQAIGKNGETLLMQSVRHHFYGIAKLLVNAGADMEIKNHKGLSAKEIAVDMKIENEVIEFIFTKAQETHLVENNLDSLDEKRIPVFS